MTIARTDEQVKSELDCSSRLGYSPTHEEKMMSDWSGGFARRKSDGRPETWGDFVTTDGVLVRCYRGKFNHCRFYDTDGQQHGPEQDNVAPARAWAFLQGWIDPKDVPLSLACIREVRENAS